MFVAVLQLTSPHDGRHTGIDLHPPSVSLFARADQRDRLPELCADLVHGFCTMSPASAVPGGGKEFHRAIEPCKRSARLLLQVSRCRSSV